MIQNLKYQLYFLLTMLSVLKAVYDGNSINFYLSVLIIPVIFMADYYYGKMLEEQDEEEDL